MLSYRSLFATVILLSCFLLAILAQKAEPPNICHFIYCEHNGSCGQTSKTSLGFQCQCEFGFTGLLCESRLNVTTCGTNTCKNNGTCSITTTQTTKCTCPAMYTGVYCETKIK